MKKVEDTEIFHLLSSRAKNVVERLFPYKFFI